MCCVYLVTQSCPTLCDPMDCSPPGSSVHGDSLGKTTGMDFHALLHGIFPIQGLNPGFLHYRWILDHLSHQGSPSNVILLPNCRKEKVHKLFNIEIKTDLMIWFLGFKCNSLPSVYLLWGTTQDTQEKLDTRDTSSGLVACWEGLGAGGEGDNRGWDGWMALLTRWTWVWVNSGSWWWTGRPSVLWFMGSQSQIWLSNWTELNWTEVLISTTAGNKSNMLPRYKVHIQEPILLLYASNKKINMKWKTNNYVWSNAKIFNN